jgi:hypothetical protein
MPVKPNKNLEALNHRQQVTNLYLQNWTQAQIIPDASFNGLRRSRAFCTSLCVNSLLHSVVKSLAFSPAFSKAIVVQVIPILTASQSPSDTQTPKVAVACGANEIAPIPVPHQPIGWFSHFPARFRSTL